MAWDDRYESRYGYWQPYIMDAIASDGCFSNKDAFMVRTLSNTTELEELFSLDVLKMLKKEVGSQMVTSKT